MKAGKYIKKSSSSNLKHCLGCGREGVLCSCGAFFVFVFPFSLSPQEIVQIFSPEGEKVTSTFAVQH